jgi:hypothetical protein
MRRMALAVVVLFGCWAAPARADTLPLIEGLPTTYTPGESFTFTIRVPELPDLTSYQLELVFSTTVTNPALLSFPTVAPSGSYVFPTSENFGFQFDAPTGTQEVRLTLTDSILPESVIATPGQNDTLATITVSPGASLTGPIMLSIGENTRFDYNAELGAYEPPTDIPPIEQAAPPNGGNPVPAPPGVVLLALGGLLLGARARFVRRA